MKWFKHECDMHTNLKIQILIAKHGLEGYAIYNLSLEMVGKEGKSGRINSNLMWKQGILKVASWSDEGKLKDILETLASIGLICSKSLKYGHLHIPSFAKRADEYSQKKSGQNPDNVTTHLGKNRIDKNRLDNILRGYCFFKNFKFENLSRSDFARNYRVIKNLIERCQSVGDEDSIVLQAIDWMSKQGYEWTLETVDKKWMEFLAKGKKSKEYLEMERLYNENSRRDSDKVTL